MTSFFHLCFAGVSCGSPPIVLRATVARTGVEYEAIARYTCFNGFFIERTETTQVTTINVTCNASGMWEPSPSQIECDRKLNLVV